MDRLSILIGRLNKSLEPTKCFFKVQQIGRFMPLIGAIRRPVESPLQGPLGLADNISRGHIIFVTPIDLKLLKLGPNSKQGK